MRAVLVLLLVVPLGLAGCTLVEEDPPEGDDTEPRETGSSGPKTHDVGMHNRMFDPDAITVPKGDTLRFAAHDTKHSVESTNGVYDAGDVPAGTEKDVWLNLEGDYVFRCNIHAGMQMSVTVTAGPAA